MKSRKGFTLIELMVVILIVGILAAVAMPIMRGRIDSAKWSEANASAGSIRTAVRAYVAEKGPAFSYIAIQTNLADPTCIAELGFSATDLAGAYFNQLDYVISAVDAATGNCIITVISTHIEGPPGTGTMAVDGSWTN